MKANIAKDQSASERPVRPPAEAISHLNSSKPCTSPYGKQPTSYPTIALPVSGLAVRCFVAWFCSVNAGVAMGQGPAEWLASLPGMAPGDFERFLLAAASALSLVALVKKVFVRKVPIEAEFVNQREFNSFRAAVKSDMEGLRDRLDARFVSLGEKMDLVKTEIVARDEHRSEELQKRLQGLEAGLARVDERTLKRV